MAVSFSGSASPYVANYLRQSDRVASAIYSLSSGNRFSESSQDISAIAIAAQLQSQNSTSRQALANGAQASSVLGVAYGGLSQISGLLTAARQLATQADSGVLTNGNRGLLDAQFSQIREQIDAIASNTQFNNIHLLDGSISGSDALSFQVGSSSTDTVDVAIDDVSSASLFSSTPSLLTQDDAKDAIDAIDAAQAVVSNLVSSVGGTLQGVSFAGTALQAGIGGLSAANGALVDTDIASASTELALILVKQQTSAAVLAQTNGLNGGLLDLLGTHSTTHASTSSSTTSTSHTASTSSSTSSHSTTA